MVILNNLYTEDTIAAISTPVGAGAIGIIRLSGKDAFDIGIRIFRPHRKEEHFPCSHRLYYGELVDGSEEVIDEVLVSFMRSPRTYTREDVVEINCHSGPVALQMVLETVLQNGARLAEAGEFTKRAFFNGRIDLAQAEGTINLINARSKKGVKNALSHIKGELSDVIKSLQQKLTAIVAAIEVSVDFPGEAEDVDMASLESELREVRDKLEELHRSREKGDIFQNGLKITIAGRPNVGKSSLLNALLARERAIVTHIPGTTRDLIEERLIWEGVPVRLTDTAGIRDTDNMVEEKGVTLSLKALRESDLILFMVDGSQSLDSDDIKIFELIREEEIKFLLLINKCDLNTVVDKAWFSEKEPDLMIINISALNKSGLEELQKEIISLVFKGDIYSDEGLLITGIRQKELIFQALTLINRVLENLADVPVDLLSDDLSSAVEQLNMLTGEKVTGDILDYVFSNFCLGK